MKTRFFLALLGLMSLALSGCSGIFGPPPEPAPTPTPTLLPPLARVIDISPNAIIIPIPIDPPSFNAYINDTGYEELVGELVYGSLAEISPTGEYYPELAVAVPTLENGGLSEDGLTVTWNLRPGLRWSDGEPFTAQDVIFTWQALRDSGIYAPGFDLITDIQSPDGLTLVITYADFYPNYRLQFGGEGVGIFPAHHCGATSEMLFWNCNFEPVSMGPYILAEWVRGQRLVFNPNPNYWQPERPLNEQLIFTIEAEKDRRAQAVAEGVAHLDLYTEPPQLNQVDDELEAGEVIAFGTRPARFVLRLVPNLSAFGTADPTQPSAFFAERSVRQAVRQAVSVPALLEGAFEGYARPINTEFARHNCPLPTQDYNPAAARVLLENAGWVDEDGDGIRECRGCANAEEGTPFSFVSYRYAEFGPVLAQAHAQIAGMLADVGIEMRPEAVEGTDLWDTWTNRGLEVRGNFYLDVWDDGYFGVDPTDYAYDFYDPRAIPTRNDPLAGLNISRYQNSELIDVFDALRRPLSEAERASIICEMAEIVARDLPQIPLVALPDYYLISPRLQGISPHIYDTVTWNAGDWSLAPVPEQ